MTVRKMLYLLGKNTIDYDMPLIAEGLSYMKIKETPLCALLLCTLIGTGIAAFVFPSSVMFTVLALHYFFNMVVYLVLKKKTDSRIKLLFGIGNMLNTADSVSRAVPELDEDIPKKLSALRPAMKISSFIVSKLINDSKDDFSALAAYLFGPFMTDILLYGRLLAILQKKHGECMAVYNYLGSIDAAISVGSFRKSLSRYCVPSFGDTDDFNFEEVVHPLIKNAVANDLSFERNIIITGSNASGKSTFVKAVAVNLILGQTINTCTAKSAVLPHCGVITSMAVKDDVLSGDSYYIREIKYLKRMTELCSQGSLLFLAIDEILKGTNTKERIAASKAVLDYFSKQHCMLMVATHDLELAKAFDKTYDNYHFAEVIGTQDVRFDYELHKGISNSSNAIKLLSAIGFPKQIIDMAQSEAEKDTV
jgi:Mismatch repair ATPase (MutS family)